MLLSAVLLLCPDNDNGYFICNGLRWRLSTSLSIDNFTSPLRTRCFGTRFLENFGSPWLALASEKLLFLQGTFRHWHGWALFMASCCTLLFQLYGNFSGHNDAGSCTLMCLPLFF